MRPLPNRVDPFGQLHAVGARGLLMGNRGGRFHNRDQTLGKRRCASRQWIACVCQFKGRRRGVWQTGYTELFFLDEVTALAAGHRLCFECRRADALEFQARFGPGGLRVAAMDRVLHAERLARHPRPAALPDLPDGAMVSAGNAAFAVRHGGLLAWHFEGYAPAGAALAGTPLQLLTPLSILEVLLRGYVPSWHPTA